MLDGNAYKDLSGGNGVSISCSKKYGHEIETAWLLTGCGCLRRAAIDSSVCWASARHPGLSGAGPWGLY
jgi:hypothetical protein